MKEMRKVRPSGQVLPVRAEETWNGNNVRSAEVKSNGDSQSLDIIVLAPAEDSSWGRFADTYQLLTHELIALGHQVRILTRRNGKNGSAYRDARWERRGSGGGYSYKDLSHLKQEFGATMRSADAVVIGSGLDDGVAICDWVTKTVHGMAVFYDFATTRTLANLEEGTCPYLSAEQISRFQLYLSVTGGRVLAFLESEYASPMARPLYHSVDTSVFYPERKQIQWDLGYFGDFDEERQPALDELLVGPARLWGKGRFAVAGPSLIDRRFWPVNVHKAGRLKVDARRAFFNSLKFALSPANPEAAESGFSPGRRLLEAAACGVPIISDYWEGLETFFEPLEHILVARCAEEALSYLRELGKEERERIGARARHRVLAGHTSRQRALELQTYMQDLIRPKVSVMA